jgi:hypothetical protein
MPLEFTLEYDHDPFEVQLQDASEEKLAELMRICKQFEHYEKCLMIQQELERRQQKKQS